MYRPIVIVSIAALSLTSPLAAQGRSGKQTRTYIDGRGRQCRETTHLKGNGDEKYEVKCKSMKEHRGHERGGDDDDDDRDDDDRDRGGRYDRPQGGGYGGYGTGSTSCFDSRNPRDTRCDVVQGRSYPTTLPDMASAVIWGRGQRTNAPTRWLGGNDYRVRYIDRDHDGRPEVASWFTSSGTMVQQWIDSNRDGRADAVKIFRDGRLVRQLGG